MRTRRPLCSDETPAAEDGRDKQSSGLAANERIAMYASDVVSEDAEGVESTSVTPKADWVRHSVAVSRKRLIAGSSLHCR